MLCGSQQADAQSKGAAGFWTVIDTENMEVTHQLLPARRRGALSPAQTSEGHAHSRIVFVYGYRKAFFIAKH